MATSSFRLNNFLRDPLNDISHVVNKYRRMLADPARANDLPQIKLDFEAGLADVLARQNTYAHAAEVYDGILEGGPRMDEDLLVYRLAPEGVYPGDEAGFLAASLREKAAENFRKHSKNYLGFPEKVYPIRIPADTPLLATTPFGTDLRWQEILVPRNSRISPTESGYFTYERR
jgi:hypothetical protein